MEIKKIKIYRTESGKEPFREWFLSLDNSQKALIQTRIKRVEYGNYGLFKKLSGGVNELKFNNGLRVYFSEVDNILILLLIGGIKKRQSNDIKDAQNFLNDYISRSKENE